MLPVSHFIHETYLLLSTPSAVCRSTEEDVLNLDVEKILLRA